MTEIIIKIFPINPSNETVNQQPQPDNRFPKVKKRQWAEWVGGQQIADLP